MSDAFLVRRGGSGGLSPNGAVIHVTAPVGSTISFAKGGVVAKVLGPEKSHVNADYNTLADWYYSVSSSNYGTWTVTATLSGNTASKTIKISTNEQYDLYFYCILPSAYQPVEYIESSGSQYINLNLSTLGAGYTVDFVCRATSAPSAGNGPAIHFGGTAYNSTAGNIAANNDKYLAWFNTVSKYFSILQGKTRFKFVFNVSDLTIDAIEDSGAISTQSWNFTVPTFSGVRLFNNSSTQYGKFRVFSLLVKNGNTKVRDMYPCYRISDSVAGLYDIANNVFYQNGGSGTFTVGPDV